MVASNVFPGSFKIGYSFEDRDPSTILAETTAQNEMDTRTEEEGSKDVPFVHTSNFFLIILTVSILASMLVLICFLCCVLHHHLKQRRNKIVIINDNKD